MLEKQVQQLLKRSMQEVETLKKPKRLSNSQLRNLKRQALAQANRQPNPFRRKPANQLAMAISQQNQLVRHQERVKSRKAHRSNAAFRYEA